MTYSDLQRVNAILGTMDIKGKAYVLVNERVKAFRQLYPEGTIQTELVDNTDGVCTFKASVIIGDLVLSTGYAQEKESSSYINKTSYIENCETSAVGRALGFLGIGIDTSIASAEEVQTAVNNQEIQKVENVKIGKTKAVAMAKELLDNGIKAETVCKAYKVERLMDLTESQHRNAMEHLKDLRALEEQA